MGFFDDNIGGARNITDILNIWNDVGVFSYVLPFVLVFAIVFAILEKSKILTPEGSSNNNRPMLAIIAAAVGLMSLQFDIVPEFFAIIFPRLGMGIAILLAVMIFIAFTAQDMSDAKSKDTWRKFMNAAGWLIGVSIIIWALDDWNAWSSTGGFGLWFSNNFWSLVILGALIAIIAVTVRGDKD